MRWALVIAALLCSLSPAQAGKVASVSTKDMAKLLVGCWATRIGGPLGVSYTACFTSKRTVDTTVFLIGGREGFGNGGTYDLTRDKLVLHTKSLDEGWFFPYQTATCDVVVRPWKALEISGCTGTGDAWYPAEPFGKSIVLRRWPTGALLKGMLQ
jgi:hypothetical protein